MQIRYNNMYFILNQAYDNLNRRIKKYENNNEMKNMNPMLTIF